MNKQTALIFFSISALLISACTTTKTATTTADAKNNQPTTEREFRAAWVATVANINWPSRPGLPVDSQKLEAIAMLDFLKAHHFNAVVFQVRPQTDALYKSELEPWSYFLTGVQGQAPSPYYDPLEFWTTAAHDRGLEMHVWLNPYRAHHISGKQVTESSIVKRKPELALYLKEGYWWLDPSLKGTQDHSAAVVMDIVKRYDIDGVHFDDYFYPYPEYNKKEDFPDSTSWKNYLAQGGKLSRSDWRRDAVNQFIERVYKEIKAEKKHVKFGLSPFGLWRPGYPEGACCFDQYETLYADAKLWLNKGWIDYFSPQLYWPINRMNLSFPVLLGWWKNENTLNRHLWPGISVGNDTSAKNVNEIMSQLMISKGMLSQSKGVIHWSIGQVYKNKNMANALLNAPYKNQALVPTTNWLDDTPPLKVAAAGASNAGDSVVINWTHQNAEDVFRSVIYYKYESGNWNYKIADRQQKTVLLPRMLVANNVPAKKLERIMVSAVDRMGNESEKINVVIPAMQ